MNTNMQVRKLLLLPLSAGAMAAILIGGISIVSIAVAAQGFDRDLAGAEASAEVAAPAIDAGATRVRRCAECGVFESMREIKPPEETAAVNVPGRSAAKIRGESQAKPLRNYEITIRLQDGSRRVVTDAKPAKWKRGEAVTVIAGLD